MKELDSEGRAWTILDINVDSKGDYNFKLSYDEPPRLTKLKNALG